MQKKEYQPLYLKENQNLNMSKKTPIRIVTAASLFDGHDVSINIIRRMLQDAGCEVIHLGHNRSVKEIVRAALQEATQGICISSYQGGHMEFFKYTLDLLNDAGASYIKIFGGGGGVITHEEKQELEDYGINKIFHPDDGNRMGLEGMINYIVKECSFDLLKAAKKTKGSFERDLGLSILDVELNNRPNKTSKKIPVLGVTGTGGAGKSSVIDELLIRIKETEKKVAVICVDPTKKKTGGSLLGDRIRMNSLTSDNFFMRSVASRGSGREIANELKSIINEVSQHQFDLIIAETSGIGQGDTAITEVSDFSLYVMTSEFGAGTQLEKIDMIDYADFISINKADHRGSQDALRDVRKQYRRSKKLFDTEANKDDTLPIFLTRAAQFNDPGVNSLFYAVMEKLNWDAKKLSQSEVTNIIPPSRQSYLAEIVDTIKKYRDKANKNIKLASNLYALESSKKLNKKAGALLSEDIKKIKEQIGKEDLELLASWDETKDKYSEPDFSYEVRENILTVPLTTKSLSGLSIKKITYPDLSDYGDRLKFLKFENVPGSFPFTSGVYPLKRTKEMPRRQFAGEGTPDKTNQRFHYLCKNDKAKRLSTAFDSVTLYGEDPDLRPDIYGKVGESGVSICNLEDMKRLYKGFDLTNQNTSVSMTINGPAPMMLAYFMNTAIDYEVEKKETELNRKLNLDEFNKTKQMVISTVRGTIQADMLKEDQAQNTCIFSIDFALKMMGDIQQYFIDNSVRNFYSVSISGYHIAEAGANPITQAAFTLANGFTYAEYYLSRGMHIDDFAPNFSFFFSNGLDPEYLVIGRVARRIWSVVMKDLYKANERSQKLKYHIQTSGRSLHSQEIDFNDIRTTLQSLIAIYDNCNSLHTNAYDEAITTPTEESVRRAMAIQMIINQEFGGAKSENINQGSWFLSELTDLVEEAVLSEFMRLHERGGVLGAMERQYQRGKIQDESMYYEHLKHKGTLPIIGINTYVNPNKSQEVRELRRATKKEKDFQLKNLGEFQKIHKDKAALELANLKKTALSNGNIFAALMSASRHCSLKELSGALYEVGGSYRRQV